MKRCNKFLGVLVIISFFSSCATIVSRSRWPLSLQTTPSNAKVIITNKKGAEVFNGNTPAVVKLKSGAGYFSKESYTVSLSLDGYETKKVDVKCTLNGWYFGNIIFGGPLGILIVDPATGAMYRLATNDINTTLTAKTTLHENTPSLNILNINQIPAKWNKHLVKLE